MKIICVGRNYAEHAAELGNEKPSQPVIFLKPDTALLRPGAPFYLPDFSQDVHFECELVIRIHKEGKHISPQFAHKYYDQIGLGIDFTARDVQNELKGKGLPWELSKSFDGSAALSPLVPMAKFPNVQNLNFKLLVNGEERQLGFTKDMIFSVNEIISFASRYFTFKIGDLIYTGTPKGVGKVNIGDTLDGYLEGESLFSLKIK